MLIYSMYELFEAFSIKLFLVLRYLKKKRGNEGMHLLA